MRSTSTPDDVINFVYLDALDGAVHASEGRFAEAVAAGIRALELAETTDYFFSRASVRVLLADTLMRSERPSEASDHASEALAILDAKGDAAGSARVRDHLDRLGIGYVT